MVYSTNQLSTITPLAGYSGHQPDTRLFNLHDRTYRTHLDERIHHFGNCEWWTNVRSYDCPICEAVTSDVSCNKTMAAQSVHEPARQAGHSLFRCVRPRCLLRCHPALQT